MGRQPYQSIIKNKARLTILDCIPAMAEEAQKGNVQAFQSLLKAAGFGESASSARNGEGGDPRKLGDTDADWKFFQKFRGKLETSLLRKELPQADETDDPRPVQAQGKPVQEPEGGSS